VVGVDWVRASVGIVCSRFCGAAGLPSSRSVGSAYFFLFRRDSLMESATAEIACQ
jgi:hypothetical protein